MKSKMPPDERKIKQNNPVRTRQDKGNQKHPAFLSNDGPSPRSVFPSYNQFCRMGGWFTLGSLLLILTAIFFLNHYTPNIGEDFGLSLHLDQYQDSIRERATAITQKIYLQYTCWNSRLGEQLAIVYLGFNKLYFNVLNVIAYYLFCYLAVFYGLGKRCSLAQPAVPLIACLTLCLMPSFGEIFMWETGAANYLHAIIVLLVFCAPYRSVLSGTVPTFGPGRTLAFCLLGFLAGMTNENTPPPFIAFIGLLAIYHYYLRRPRLPAWYWGGLLSLTAGFLSLVFSPSTRHRMKFYNDTFGAQEVTFSTYLLRLKDVISTFMSNSVGLLICVIVMACIWHAVQKYARTKGKHPKLYETLALFILSLISLTMLIFPPYYEIRAFLLVWFFMLALAARFFTDVADSKRKTIPLVLTALVFFIVQAGQALVEYRQFYAKSEKRHDLIMKARLSGNMDITVPPVIAASGRMLNTREGWLKNQPMYAKYYGVNSIRFSSNATSGEAAEQSAKPAVDTIKTRSLFALISGQQLGENGGKIEIRDAGILIHPGIKEPTQVSFDVKGKYETVTLIAFVAALPPEALKLKGAGTTVVEFFIDGKPSGHARVTPFANYEKTFNLQDAKKLSVIVDSSDDNSYDWMILGVQ